jgi:cytochrome bd ubiquinol oxidase subunit II
VLRGAAFTFRLYDGRDATQKAWGIAFSVSSVVAPLALGTIVGALASGGARLGDGARAGAADWLGPFSLAVGVFAAALFAFLAATYLAVEAQGALRDDFRRRALAAGAAVFVAAAVALVLSARDAPLVFHGLTRRAWSMPFHVATGAAAVVALRALATRRVRLARTAAGAQSALIVLGWGASQYPYLVVPDLTLASASAPARTQHLLLLALAGGALLLFPCLYLLFRVFKGDRPFAVLDRSRPRKA